MVSNFHLVSKTPPPPLILKHLWIYKSKKSCPLSARNLNPISVRIWVPFSGGIWIQFLPQFRSHFLPELGSNFCQNLYTTFCQNLGSISDRIGTQINQNFSNWKTQPCRAGHGCFVPWEDAVTPSARGQKSVTLRTHFPPCFEYDFCLNLDPNFGQNLTPISARICVPISARTWGNFLSEFGSKFLAQIGSIFCQKLDPIFCQNLAPTFARIWIPFSPKMLSGFATAAKPHCPGKKFPDTPARG